MHSLYEYVLVRDSYRYEMLTAMWGERQARVGWQSGKKLEMKLASGRSLPNTSSWVRDDRERGLMVHHCCHAADIHGAAQDGHGCGLEVKWRESLHARDNPQTYTG